MTTATRDETAVVRPAWPATTGPDDTIDLRDDRQPRVIPASEVAPRRRRGATALRVLGFLVAATLLCGVAAVAAINRVADVRIDAEFDTMRVPVWALIAVATGIGFVAGRLLDDRS